MTTPRLEAAQQRLARLLEQKKALEAKISREQGLLRERERKARTRRLIEYGGLVAIAGLDEEDKGTVLGLLLEGARRLKVDTKTRQRWKQLGDKELAVRAAHAAAHTPGGGQDGAGTPTTEEISSAAMGGTERDGPGDVSSEPTGEEEAG